jgi:predicted DNA-binding protein (UPF0251 family)
MVASPREKLAFLLVEDRGYAQDAAGRMMGVTRQRVGQLLAAAWRKYAAVKQSCPGVDESKIREQFLAA